MLQVVKVALIILINVLNALKIRIEFYKMVKEVSVYVLQDFLKFINKNANVYIFIYHIINNIK